MKTPLRVLFEGATHHQRFCGGAQVLEVVEVVVVVVTVVVMVKVIVKVRYSSSVIFLFHFVKELSDGGKIFQFDLNVSFIFVYDYVVDIAQLNQI
ncbi:hypothetical protein E2C01_087982 [Portunus trituberculatus]|uniref:Uncharacterized protein n=1 Tax=Portunus trituberculatus TaxID=210409 RepID=A0A5B7J802_PORTR|nr:hypothetical protein [Portunus trituberculatus]